jgi:two-component system OmpR family sensor kinase
VSLRGRLLAASLALVAAGLSVAGVATYSELRSFLFHRVDTQLTATHQNVERALAGPGGHFLESSLRQLGTIAPGVFVQVRDESGATVLTAEGRSRDDTPLAPALPGRLPTPSGKAGPGAAEPATFLSTASAGSSGPGYRVRVSPLAGGGTLIVALPLGDSSATLHRLVVVETLVGLGVLVAAALSGAWLVRLGLRPLREIEETAETIAEGTLTERVPREGDRTEVGRLARSLNVMLARLEAAFSARRESEETLRRFVSDASHELRTPVAAIRAYAELYRRGAARHPDDLPRVMERIEREASRVGLLVEDLLLLSRLDQGRPLTQAPVDLGAVAADAVHAARAVEPDRPVSLRVEGSVEVLGDKDRLRQVLDNLLANVRTHTPPGAPADVTVRSDGRRAVVEVADRGPGVPDEQVPLVFERFYRADPSRARDRGGAGLGLSIVSAIAAAHDGSASVSARPGGGAVFRLDLPALAEAWGEARDAGPAAGATGSPAQEAHHPHHLEAEPVSQRRGTPPDGDG